MNPDALIEFFHGLSPQSVVRFPKFYSADAYFKDPFNEVRSVAAVQRIFTHMFEQVAEPRFIVTEKVVDNNGAMLIWTFNFRAARWGGSEMQVIRGVSHLKFDVAGKVNYHRDYWDAAEELYMKLPVLGMLMRVLRRPLASAPDPQRPLGQRLHLDRMGLLDGSRRPMRRAPTPVLSVGHAAGENLRGIPSAMPDLPRLDAHHRLGQ